MKPYYQDDYVTLYHGDCREIVPQLGKFELILTDPPYGKVRGDFAGMDTWAGRRNATQAILEGMTGQTNQQKEGRSK